MGQGIFTIEPGATAIIFNCDGCRHHSDFYTGPGYIEMRAQAHADGWRRRSNQWFKNECVPKGKDDAEA